MMRIPKTDELFDIGHSIAKDMLEKCEYPHSALPLIEQCIIKIIPTLDRSYREINDGVFVAKDAKVWDGATITGPTIIGHNAEIRPGAFIRGRVIIGDGAVIGNSTEIKNSIVFDEVQLPHYNYVGDSIIGYRAHMGAGSIASNLRLDKKEIILSCEGDTMKTGLRKVGAFIGDYAEVGCGCVLCPGAVIGRESVIYPLVCANGYIPERSILDGKTIKNKIIGE